MSKNDMLAPIIRALVGVPQERLGVVLDAVNKIGSTDGALWRTRLAEVLRAGVKLVTPLPEVPLDTLVHAQASPIGYDLKIVKIWTHEHQLDYDDQLRTIQDVYEHLKRHNRLDSCLRLQDGLAIQQKGAEIFSKFFPNKALLLFGSVGLNSDGSRCVPCLFKNINKGMLVGWERFDGYWRGYYHCAPYFGS